MSTCPASRARMTVPALVGRLPLASLPVVVLAHLVRSVVRTPANFADAAADLALAVFRAIETGIPLTVQHGAA